MITRRVLLGSAVLATLAWPRAGDAEDEIADKRLANRLELWANYSKRTRNLLARVTTTRDSALLDAPLVTTGDLMHRGPDLLVLRDDGLAGSTTIVDGHTLEILPNQVREAGARLVPTIDGDRSPAAGWLAQRLLHLFAAGDGAELIAGCRTDVPRGGFRLDLLPPRASATRKLIRSVTVHLDPVAGAVTQILIAEAQGDRVRLQLSDHRQNVPDADLAASLADATALRAAWAAARKN